MPRSAQWPAVSAFWKSSPQVLRSRTARATAFLVSSGIFSLGRVRSQFASSNGLSVGASADVSHSVTASLTSLAAYSDRAVRAERREAPQRLSASAFAMLKVEPWGLALLQLAGLPKRGPLSPAGCHDSRTPSNSDASAEKLRFFLSTCRCPAAGARKPWCDGEAPDQVTNASGASAAPCGSCDRSWDHCVAEISPSGEPC
mmetsp:Transcript_8298/g.21002  ORF Transcript_8298/g.21002 Transcript_8298/m.21002 type:complete len:201 (+) Transcript_8298:287-889(+)